MLLISILLLTACSASKQQTWWRWPFAPSPYVTINPRDGLPDFKYIKGLGHLLPDDALFLEGVCARINNPVRLFDSDFITYIAWLRWCDLLAGT